MTRAEARKLAIAEMAKENARLRKALRKIVRLYVKAPGWAAPTPTTKLVWGMYDTARIGLGLPR